MKKIVSFILIAALGFSCKDEFTICDLPTAVRMKCGFYQSNAGTETEIAAPFLTVIKISSPNPDYALPTVSKFSLSLNPIADSVQYQISVREASMPDTVTFVYTSEQINVSAICGNIYVNNLTRVTTTINTLDSVKISNNTINTTSGENLRIYF